MTTTSPIEVIPKDPTIITSPYDAVIKEIVVHNNDTVNKRDLLVLLEDSELINQVNLAERTLNVAETELLRSRQASFTSPKEKSRLAELMAQVELREVELNYAQERLETSRIHALSTGVAIVNDLEDWKGRPVAVGERIITIADPNQIEFLIWLPVKDAVVIENNSLVKMFLDINRANYVVAEMIVKRNCHPFQIFGYSNGKCIFWIYSWGTEYNSMLFRINI